MSAVPLSDEEILRWARETVQGAAEERWSDPYRDAPVAGVPLAGKSRAAAAPEASSFLIVFHSLTCVRRSYRE